MRTYDSSYERVRDEKGCETRGEVALLEGRGTRAEEKGGEST
jgi:hypothetical protein